MVDCCQQGNLTTCFMVPLLAAGFQKNNMVVLLLIIVAFNISLVLTLLFDQSTEDALVTVESICLWAFLGYIVVNLLFSPKCFQVAWMNSFLFLQSVTPICPVIIYDMKRFVGLAFLCLWSCLCDEASPRAQALVVAASSGEKRKGLVGR